MHGSQTLRALCSGRIRQIGGSGGTISPMLFQTNNFRSNYMIPMWHRLNHVGSHEITSLYGRAYCCKELARSALKFEVGHVSRNIICTRMQVQHTRTDINQVTQLFPQ